MRYNVMPDVGPAYWIENFRNVREAEVAEPSVERIS